MTTMSTPGRSGPAACRRRIGPLGTTARVVLGAGLLGAVGYGQWAGSFRGSSIVVGLLVLPGLVLVAHGLVVRRRPGRLVACGPLAHVVNVAAFLALWVTWYPDPLIFLSDAALVFYGTSMVLAARLGYGGCEVLAISNRLLRRDDQVGCLVFGPVDHLEAALRHGHPAP